MEDFEKAIKAHNLKQQTQVISHIPNDEDPEFAKGHPVGYINKYGKQKQSDGSWKYVGKGRAGGAAKKTSEKKDSSRMPKVGATVRINEGGVKLISLQPFTGKDLTVEKIVNTGLISEPQQVKVTDGKGSSIIVSKNDLKEVPKAQEKTTKTQEKYSPKSDEAFKVRSLLKSNSLARKPVYLSELNNSTVKVPSGSKLAEEIGKLTEIDLTKWAGSGNHMSRDLPKEVQGGLFVAKIKDDKYLINTEGADYIRYGGKISSNIKKSEDIEYPEMTDISKAEETLSIGEFEKGLPVGHINKYGKQKQSDDSWKYVGKSRATATGTPTKKG